MEALNIFNFPARFALKVFWFGFISIIAILFLRIGYCYLVASSSLNEVMPQIARVVAEYNGTPISGEGVDATKGIEQLLIEACTIYERQSDGTIRPRMNAAYQYYFGGSPCTRLRVNPTDLNQRNPYSFNTIDEDEIIWDLEHGEDKGTATNPNCSLQVHLKGNNSRLLVLPTPTSNHRLAQRGDLIEIDLTVWATVSTGIILPGDSNRIVGDWKFPITKRMVVPAVKYYRGYD